MKHKLGRAQKTLILNRSKKKEKESADLPDQVPLFIKFVGREFLSEFLINGQLHFGTLKEYRDIALPGVGTQTNSSVGDLNEGIFHREIGQGNLLVKSGNRLEENRKLVGGESISIRSLTNTKAAVFCFTAVPRTALIKKENGNYRIGQRFIDAITSEFTPEDKIAVVLRDVSYIWSRLKLLFKGTECARGPILYEDNQFFAIQELKRNFREKSISEQKLVAFTKGSRYQDQYEYRFYVADDQVLNKKHNINIGHLFDHVEVVSDLKDISIQSFVEHRLIGFDEVYEGLRFHKIAINTSIVFRKRCFLGKVIVKGISDELGNSSIGKESD